MDQTFAEALSLTREAFGAELWRLWSGHVVHYTAAHVLLNVAAAVPAVVMVERRSRLLWWALAAAPLISIVLLLLEPRIEYRGASALVLGAWFFAGLSSFRTGRAMAVALLVLATVKLLGETAGLVPWNVGVESSIAAHWMGAVAGVIGGSREAFSRVTDTS